jgi:hypothetical protein
MLFFGPIPRGFHSPLTQDNNEEANLLLTDLDKQRRAILSVVSEEPGN